MKKIPMLLSLALALGAANLVQAASTDMTDGEIRKVDAANKKLTIRHGEIKNLDMPGMTMVFQVRDPALLDKLIAGEKIKFTAEQMQGAFVVTSVELAPTK